MNIYKIMKTISNKILRKSFDLKNANLYGGIGTATRTECQSFKKLDNGCTEVTTTIEDDFAKVISEKTETVCP